MTETLLLSNQKKKMLQKWVGDTYECNVEEFVGGSTVHGEEGGVTLGSPESEGDAVFGGRGQ